MCTRHKNGTVTAGGGVDGYCCGPAFLMPVVSSVNGEGGLGQAAALNGPPPSPATCCPASGKVAQEKQGESLAPLGTHSTCFLTVGEASALSRL